MNHANSHQSGFTLVELMLSMAFISVLLLAIALTIMQIGTLYMRGITLKEVNQAGSALIADVQTTIAGSSVMSVGGDGADFKMQKALNGQLAGGRLCTGTESYIWNLGSHLDTPINMYDTQTTPIHFVKVDDRSKAYCANTDKKIAANNARELLPNDDAGLVVQDFTIHQIAYNPVRGDALYEVTIEIGTNDRSTLDTTPNGLLNSIDTTCKVPSDAASQQAFCAVNRFDFTAETGTTTGGEQ